jgi:hypothetical protein
MHAVKLVYILTIIRKIILKHILGSTYAHLSENLPLLCSFVGEFLRMAI